MKINLGQNERDLERTTLLMFEIGTGRASAELKSLFEVSSMRFSPDGRYLTLGSRGGSVCVWALGEHLFQNIKQVLDAARVQPDFWANYPIFLEDYGTYGMAQSLPSPDQFFSTQDQRQLDRPEDFANDDFYGDGQFDPLSPLDERLDFGSDRGDLLTSQRLQPLNQRGVPQSANDVRGQKPFPTYQNTLQKQALNQRDQGQPVYPTHLKQTNTNNPQQLGARIQHLQDPNIQASLQKRNPPASQIRQQPQQPNKFIRKTFVEDQQTQITPDQLSCSYLPNMNQNLAANAQVQTSNYPLNQGHPSSNRIPSRNGLLNQHSSQQRSQNRAQGVGSGLGYLGGSGSEMKRQGSQSSLISSPNRAELLYRDEPLENPYSIRQKPQPAHNQMRRQGQDTQRAPALAPDFIDRTANAPLNKTQPQRNIFQEAEEQFESLNIGGNLGRSKAIPQHKQIPQSYEENLDAADLYNPFTLNQNQIQNSRHQVNSSAFGPMSASPITTQAAMSHHITSGLGAGGTVGVNYLGGPLKPLDQTLPTQRHQKDPIDIDDDVSDHGLESLENQLRQLDGMNKYLHNVRVPTRFVNDEFLAVNGRDGQQAYTLGRLREEERLMNMDPATLDNRGLLGDEEPDAEILADQGVLVGHSNYDLVEEMYEDINDFDQRLKFQKRQGAYF